MTVHNRYDFVLLFDVLDGNPNGDPDAHNQPRVDPETGHGIVTDVAIKRRIRDFVTGARLDEQGAPQAGFEIYVKHRGILAHEQRRAYQAVGALDGSDRPNARARSWMCQQFWDVRTFGAVMSAGRASRGKADGDVYWNCGQVRGPVQLTFARSIEPITVVENAITRTAQTNPTGDDDSVAATGQMGRKYTVPYAVYRAHGFISPRLAAETGFSAADLEVLWESLLWMFEHDRSASRGLMSTAALIIFKHESALGDAFAGALFDRVAVRTKTHPPRSRSDWELLVDGKTVMAREGKLILPARA
jgi:CRISPR-associated protein Csd2